MDRILQYQKLIDVKPEYYILSTPYRQASHKRFIFNVKELELWYDEEFDVFTPGPPSSQKEEKKNHNRRDRRGKRGGNEKSQIIFLEFNFANESWD
jgi:hypothetical protein